MTVTTPATQGQRVPTEHVAPGRLRATVPDAGPGLYTLMVSTALGAQRLLHLRRNRAENDAWGTNPALDAWRTAGLVSNWDPGFMAQQRDENRTRRPVDRSLLGLALALFLSGVLVDRTRLRKPGAGSHEGASRPPRQATIDCL
jgi:hypothetical protein